MAAAIDSYEGWLAQAHLPEHRLRPEQQALLQAVFRFRQSQGADYYSTRLLGHFLLHCGSGLMVATIARLLGISRPTASRQQALSSKQAVQQAHHRMDGRPYGKLLPRYAGPIAGFLCTHPDATRADLIDFVSDAFGVRVSRIALYKFLKKYGLDQVAPPPVARPRPRRAAPAPGPPTSPRPSPPLPPFARADAVRGRLPDAGPGPDLAAGGARVLPRPAGRPDARAPDQRLRPGRRPGASLPPRRDGGPGIRPADRRPPLPLPPRRRRLAAAPAVVGGRGLLPPHQPLGVDPRGGGLAQLRRAHHPPLDAQVPRPEGLRHHSQQVHALREALLHLRRAPRPLPGRARHPGDWGLSDQGLPLLLRRGPGSAGRPDYVHALFDAGAGTSTTPRCRAPVGPGGAGNTPAWT